MLAVLGGPAEFERELIRARTSEGRARQGQQCEARPHAEAHGPPATRSHQAAREIAWKAQMRLCGRFRTLTRKGKRPTIVVTAIARELSAFIWAINREVGGSQATANQ
jgi:DNA invertase Pin-like site-specific DNA recombinase